MQNIGSFQHTRFFFIYFSGGNGALEYACVSYVEKVHHTCPFFGKHNWDTCVYGHKREGERESERQEKSIGKKREGGKGGTAELLWRRCASRSRNDESEREVVMA